MFNPIKSIRFTEEHQFDGVNYCPKSEALNIIRNANERIIELEKTIKNSIMPDDIQAYDAVMELRKEIKDKGKDEDFADVNSWLMGVNWCKDYIENNS